MVMRMAQGARHLTREPQRLLERQRPLARQARAQRLPFHVRHDVEEMVPGRAGIEQGNDMRMVQPRRDLDLSEEPILTDGLHHGWLHHFDRDEAVVLRVFRQVDGRHAAAADLADRAVTVENERRRQARGDRIG